ncbi:MAG: hypothetical protein NTV55_08520, partial [Planctomycetota bacterium]|nr:hypothetical protein [Planctomycetota bacterium]
MLLGRAVPAEMPGTIRHLNERVRLIPPNIDRQWKIFDTAVSLGGLVANDELSRGLNRAQLGLMEEKSAQQAGAKPGDSPRFAGSPAVPMGPGGGGFGGGGAMGGIGGERGGAMGGMGGRQSAKAAADMAPKDSRGDSAKRRMFEDQKKSEAESLNLAGEDKPVNAGEKDLDALGEFSKQLGDVRLPALRKNADSFYLNNRASVALLEQLYRPVAPTTEWAENNYDRLPIGSQTPELAPAGLFWLDLARHDEKTPFLSKHLGDATHTVHEALLALAMVDLPFKAAKAEVKFAGPRLTYKAASPTIVYHEEIRPSLAAQGKLPILVSQNLFDPVDRFRTENGEKIDRFLDAEVLVQRVLGCQVVVTNPSSGRQRLSVLVQIPQGAMPLGGAQV